MSRTKQSIGFIATATVLAFSRQIEVSTAEQLLAATTNAVAGDTIIVAPGEYIGTIELAGDPGNLPNGKGNFWIGNNGTAENPIVVMGKDRTSPPVLKGEDMVGGYVFHITGDHVVLKNLVLTSAEKGVIFDNSNYSILEDCEIHNTNSELVHVRDGSSHTIIHRNKLYNSGNNGNGSIGEGLYIGTDQARWGADDRPQTEWGDKAISEGYGGYDWRVDSTQILYNYLSGNISAECIDVKEGTTNTIVKGNMFVGDSIGRKVGNEYYDDSFIDQKGVSGTFTGNMFFAGGNGITKYISEVTRSSYAHIPATLTADKHSSTWCDNSEFDKNVGFASDNEIVTTAIDPRPNSPHEFFVFFSSDGTTLPKQLESQSSAAVSPRITSNGCTINSVATYDNASISIVTLSGRTIYRWNGAIPAGDMHISFDDSAISQGNYILLMNLSSEQTFAQKIAVR